jgi:hypothetical protein
MGNSESNLRWYIVSINELLVTCLGSLLYICSQRLEHEHEEPINFPSYSPIILESVLSELLSEVALTITHGNTQNTVNTEIKKKKSKGKSSKMLCFNISYDLFFTYII